MVRKRTKAYPESFRREAVRLADLPDRTAADVARELGIHVGQIYNWRPRIVRCGLTCYCSRTGVYNIAATTTKRHFVSMVFAAA